VSDSDRIPADAKTYGLELRLDAAYEGIDKLWPKGVDKLPLRGKWMTKDEFKAAIDAERQPWKVVRAAKQVVRQFSIDKPGHKQTATQLLDDLKNTMATQHGGECEKLTEMGFKPRRKRRPLSSEKALQANAKRKRTRELRGTKGKRQLAAIKYEGTPFIPVKADGTSVVDPDGPPPPATPFPTSVASPPNIAGEPPSPHGGAPPPAA
jgi:hypothetical protein